MSRLYPTLEDLKVDEIQQAQNRAAGGQFECTASAIVAPDAGSLYPRLNEFLGLNLDEVNTALVSAHGANSLVQSGEAWNSGQLDVVTGNRVVAPVTHDDRGIMAAAIKQGLRRVVLCKDNKGVMGMCVQAVDNGLFVSFVQRDSPAAMGGVRFGEQILEINGEVVAGWSTDKAVTFMKKADGGRIEIVLRDRPFQRTVTMNKDSTGTMGFAFKKLRITDIVAGSSAARNGILTDHYITEVNGRCVIGLKDAEVTRFMDQSERTLTITIIPTTIYDQLLKKIGSDLKKQFDHAAPAI